MRRRMQRFLILLYASLFVPALWADDWTQWRGPNRDGRVYDFSAPAIWPDSLTRIWRIPIGAGISSPLVADGKTYLLTREGEEEAAICLRLQDGKTLWRLSYRSPFIPNSQAVRPRLFPKSGGKGPFATPVLFEGCLYTVGVDRVVSCFDATNGDLKWRHHFFKKEMPQKMQYECPPCGCSVDGQKFDAPGTCSACGMAYGPIGLETSVVDIGNYYGAAASPLIFADELVVHVGNGEKGSLISLDAKTGQQIWQWSGPAMASSSPIITKIAGQQQLVTLTRLSVVSVSPLNGKELWSFPIESNAQIITPVAYENLIVFSTYRGPVTAIEIEKSDHGWTAEQRWQNSDLSFYMSSPILDGQFLYGLSYTERGQYACLDVRSGETVWTSEGRMAMSAALLDIGDEIAALTYDGRLTIVAQNDNDFEIRKEYAVSEHPVWAHPVMWGNHILIKDEADLTLWRVE